MPRPPLTAAEAVRVLETVEALTARVSAAVADCDPLAMSSALRACEAVGVEVEPMATARDVLGLDRAAFLRRELSSVLHTHQLAAAAAASAAAAGAAPAEPAAAPSRAPSQTELRIVHCTLQVRREREREGGRREGVPATPSPPLPPHRPSQLKDQFFGELAGAPHVDAAAAAASDAATVAAVAAAAQRVEDNVAGARARLSPNPQLQARPFCDGREGEGTNAHLHCAPVAAAAGLRVGVRVYACGGGLPAGRPLYRREPGDDRRRRTRVALLAPAPPVRPHALPAPQARARERAAVARQPQQEQQELRETHPPPPPPSPPIASSSRASSPCLRARRRASSRGSTSPSTRP